MHIIVVNGVQIIGSSIDSADEAHAAAAAVREQAGEGADVAVFAKLEAPADPVKQGEGS